MAVETSLGSRSPAEYSAQPERTFADWWRTHARKIAAMDLAMVLIAVTVGLGIDLNDGGWSPVRYASPFALAVSALVVAGWMWALSLARTRDRRIVGFGPAEYSRVAQATWMTFAVVAVVSYAFQLSIARSHVAVALPLGLALLLGSRNICRRRLDRMRQNGQALASVLVAGHGDSVGDLIARLRKRPEFGYRVVAACLPSGELPAAREFHGVPVVGTLDAAAGLASELGVDVVAVTGSDATTAAFVRRLGWALSPYKIDLMLASSLTDVAGPRIIVTPADGTRLVHVDAPRFTGWRYVVKTGLDMVTAAAIILVLSPLLIATAIAVKVTSPGAVIFKQTRIGRNGVPFTMFKFRSMAQGSDKRLDDVIDGDVGLFYKAKDDPRVTRVGKIIRRTSIDELPQLFNVLKGDMSLVGPRPQVEREVALYDGVISRRLLVKPGLTGLWQVSGRSNLSIEESIRCDLTYVENWTLMGDLMILTRTLRAVVAGAGAY